MFNSVLALILSASLLGPLSSGTAQTIDAVENQLEGTANTTLISSKNACDNEYKILGNACRRLKGAPAAVCWAAAAAAYAACLAGKTKGTREYPTTQGVRFYDSARYGTIRL